MTSQQATADFLKALGINPDTVERVLFDHRAGQPPTLTVWLMPHRDQWQQAVSSLTRVYRLEADPYKETEK